MHAETAREILEGNDCVTPHVNGIRDLENGAATLLGDSRLIPATGRLGTACSPAAYWSSSLATRRSRVASLITTQATTIVVATASVKSAPRPVMKCQTASP